MLGSLYHQSHNTSINSKENSLYIFTQVYRDEKLSGGESPAPSLVDTILYSTQFNIHINRKRKQQASKGKTHGGSWGGCHNVLPTLSKENHPLVLDLIHLGRFHQQSPPPTNWKKHSATLACLYPDNHLSTPLLTQRLISPDGLTQRLERGQHTSPLTHHIHY